MKIKPSFAEFEQMAQQGNLIPVYQEFMQDQLSIQVGAGIVYDSSPENEYEETLRKAEAMFKAIEMVKENDRVN